MKILIIADTLDVNKSSGAKASMALVHSLQKCGYEIKVLHYSRKHLAIKDVVVEAIKENKITHSPTFFQKFRYVLTGFLKSI